MLYVLICSSRCMSVSYYCDAIFLETCQTKSFCLHQGKWSAVAKRHRKIKVPDMSTFSTPKSSSSQKQRRKSSTPKQGQLTGLARKISDGVADIYNSIQKWETLKNQGFNIVTDIANCKIEKRCVQLSLISANCTIFLSQLFVATSHRPYISGPNS